MNQLIATKCWGRTIAGIKGKDEEHMWKTGAVLWGMTATENDVKIMRGDSAEDLDRFVGDCGVSFASKEAFIIYDKFCLNNE